MSKRGRKSLPKEIWEERLSGTNIQIIGQYVNSVTPVMLFCNICNHEWKTQLGVIKRGSGCPNCFYRSRTHTKEEVNCEIKKYNIEIIGEYINDSIKTEFMCSNNHVWLATPNNIKNGFGCPICNDTRLSVETVNKRLEKLGLKLLDDYINTKIKYRLLCTCGNIWNVKLKNVFGRSSIGCPACVDYGFNYSKKTILYYIKIKKDIEFFKIGITNFSVEERFSGSILDNIEILKEIVFDTGEEAKDKEQEILKKYKKYRYYGEKIINGTGNTELFNIDISSLKGFNYW